MLISDLNHLEVVENKSVVGGISDISNIEYLSFTEWVDVDKDFDVSSTVSGKSAFAEADSYATGCNFHAEALSFTYVSPCYATASATSLAQAA